jgi:hypothetical protein
VALSAVGSGCVAGGCEAGGWEAGGCVAGGCVAGSDVMTGVDGVGVRAGRATEDWSVRGVAGLCSPATAFSVGGATLSSISGHLTCGGGFTRVGPGGTSSRTTSGESASGLKVKK